MSPTLRRPVAALLLAAVASCSTGPTVADSLSTTPLGVVIGSDAITVDGWADRDFMPVSPPDGKPLVAAVTLHGATPDLAVTQLWVVQGDAVWRAAPDSAYGTTWLARGGPKWAPGSEVYVVVELAHAGMAVARVRTPAITITKSE